MSIFEKRPQVTQAERLHYVNLTPEQAKQVAFDGGVYKANPDDFADNAELAREFEEHGKYHNRNWCFMIHINEHGDVFFEDTFQEGNIKHRFPLTEDNFDDMMSKMELVMDNLSLYRPIPPEDEDLYDPNDIVEVMLGSTALRKHKLWRKVNIEPIRERESRRDDKTGDDESKNNTPSHDEENRDERFRTRDTIIASSEATEALDRIRLLIDSFEIDSSDHEQEELDGNTDTMVNDNKKNNDSKREDLAAALNDAKKVMYDFFDTTALKRAMMRLNHTLDIAKKTGQPLDDADEMARRDEFISRLDTTEMRFGDAAYGDLARWFQEETANTGKLTHTQDGKTITFESNDRALRFAINEKGDEQLEAFFLPGRDSVVLMKSNIAEKKMIHFYHIDATINNIVLAIEYVSGSTNMKIDSYASWHENGEAEEFAELMNLAIEAFDVAKDEFKDEFRINEMDLRKV